MTEKITGYALIAIGLIIIFGCIFNVLGILAKQATPVRLFSFSGLSFDLGTALPGMNAKQEIVSGKELSDTVNLFAHIVLLGFIINAAGKIAQIGTNLVRQTSS